MRAMHRHPTVAYAFTVRASAGTFAEYEITPSATAKQGRIAVHSVSNEYLRVRPEWNTALDTTYDGKEESGSVLAEHDALEEQRDREQEELLEEQIQVRLPIAAANPVQGIHDYRSVCQALLCRCACTLVDVCRCVRLYSRAGRRVSLSRSLSLCVCVCVRARACA